MEDNVFRDQQLTDHHLGDEVVEGTIPQQESKSSRYEWETGRIFGMINRGQGAETNKC